MVKGKKSPMLLAQQGANRKAGGRAQRRREEAAMRKLSKLAHKIVNEPVEKDDIHDR